MGDSRRRNFIIVAVDVTMPRDSERPWNKKHTARVGASEGNVAWLLIGCTTCGNLFIMCLPYAGQPIEYEIVVEGLGEFVT